MLSNPKLTLELIPRTSWGNNIRAHVSASKWRVFRAECLEKAGHKCEICGRAETPGYSLEAHEVWSYNDQTGIQKLVALVALCPACHQVKHAGRAKLLGKEAAVVAQLQKVNGWTEAQVRSHFQESFALWASRSQMTWTLDLSLLL